MHPKSHNAAVQPSLILFNMQIRALSHFLIAELISISHISAEAQVQLNSNRGWWRMTLNFPL